MNLSNENNNAEGDAGPPSLRNCCAFTLATHFFHPLEALDHEWKHNDDDDHHQRQQHDHDEKQSQTSIEAIDVMLSILPEELLLLIAFYVSPFHLLLFQRYCEAKLEKQKQQRKDGDDDDDTEGRDEVGIPSYMKEVFQKAWCEKVTLDHHGYGLRKNLPLKDFLETYWTIYLQRCIYALFNIVMPQGNDKIFLPVGDSALKELPFLNKTPYRDRSTPHITKPDFVLDQFVKDYIGTYCKRLFLPNFALEYPQISNFITLLNNMNSIGFMNLRDEGIDNACSIIQKMTNVTKIALRFGKTTPKLTEKLLKELAQSSNVKNLSMLDLTCVDIHSCSVDQLLSIIQNRALTTLTLVSNRIVDREGKAVVEALVNHPSLTLLRVHDQDLGEETATAIGKLANNSKLESLNIASNNFSDQCGKIIFEALNHNMNVKTLNYSDNFIDEDEGAGKALVNLIATNRSITSLNVGTCSFEKKEGIEIANALATQNSTIEEADFRRNSFGTQAGLVWANVLKSNHTLTSLNLSFTSMGRSKGFVEFCEALINSSVTTLILNSNSITNIGGTKLAEVVAKRDPKNSIRTLSIVGNPINEVTAEAFIKSLSESNAKLSNLNIPFSCLREWTSGIKEGLSRYVENVTVDDQGVFDGLQEV